jgi:hypothetical protein
MSGQPVGLFRLYWVAIGALGELDRQLFTAHGLDCEPVGQVMDQVIVRYRDIAC